MLLNGVEFTVGCPIPVNQWNNMNALAFFTLVKLVLTNSSTRSEEAYIWSKFTLYQAKQTNYVKDIL